MINQVLYSVNSAISTLIRSLTFLSCLIFEHITEVEPYPAILGHKGRTQLFTTNHWDQGD